MVDAAEELDVAVRQRTHQVAGAVEAPARLRGERSGTNRSAVRSARSEVAAREPGAADVAARRDTPCGTGCICAIEHVDRVLPIGRPIGTD